MKQGMMKGGEIILSNWIEKSVLTILTPGISGLVVLG